MLVSVLCLLLLSCSFILGQQINGKITLEDEPELFAISWKVDLSNDTITFNVTAATPGFVGFGLSPQATMRGSDIVVGGVDNGVPYFSDRHGLGSFLPPEDESQDWVLLSASENSTHTNLVFSRALDTGDDDDLPITNQTTNFIWSIGATDTIQYHIVRGSVDVNFLHPSNTIVV